MLVDLLEVQLGDYLAEMCVIKFTLWTFFVRI